MKKTGSKSRWRWWKKINYSLRRLHGVFLQSAKQAFHHSMALRGEVLLRLDHTTLVFAPRPDFLLFSFCSRVIPLLRNSTMVPGNSFREILSGRRGTISLRPGRISRRRGRISWHKMILDIICIRKNRYKWIDFKKTNLTEEARLHKVRVERYLDLLLGWICPNLFLPGPMDLKGAGSHNQHCHISHS